MNKEIEQRVQQFVDIVNNKLAIYWVECGYTHSKAPITETIPQKAFVLYATRMPNTHLKNHHSTDQSWTQPRDPTKYELTVP